MNEWVVYSGCARACEMRFNYPRSLMIMCNQWRMDYGCSGELNKNVLKNITANAKLPGAWRKRITHQRIVRFHSGERVTPHGFSVLVRASECKKTLGYHIYEKTNAHGLLGVCCVSWSLVLVILSTLKKCGKYV